MKEKKNIYNFKAVNIIFYITYSFGLILSGGIGNYWYWILSASVFMTSFFLFYTKKCPLAILARFGILKFFKASKIAYGKRFIPAIFIYGTYPISLITIILLKIFN